MQAHGDFSLAEKYRGHFRGHTQTIQVDVDDGFSYALNLCADRRRMGLLLREAIGSQLLQDSGLFTPSWRPILLTKAFLESMFKQWDLHSSSYARPDVGLYFGSRLIDSKENQVWGILPGKWYDRLQNRQSFIHAWLLDLCADMTKPRNAIFVGSSAKVMSACFLGSDHMFGRDIDKFKRTVRTPCYYDFRAYGSIASQNVSAIADSVRGLDTDSLWHTAINLPTDWRDRRTLETVSTCLGRFEDHSLIQMFLEMILHEVHSGLEESAFIATSNHSMSFSESSECFELNGPAQDIKHGIPSNTPFQFEK